jgi:hypothetical protein
MVPLVVNPSLPTIPLISDHRSVLHPAPILFIHVKPPRLPHSPLHQPSTINHSPLRLPRIALERLHHDVPNPHLNC